MLIKKKKIPIKEIILIGFLPSFLKKMVYRLKGYKIGKNVSFGIGSVIIGKDVSIGNETSFGFVSVVRADHIDIGRHVTIGTLTMIDTVKVIIGDDSRINEKVIVGGIKTPESILKVGKRVIIMEYSFINPTKPIFIGDDSGIGGHCLLFTHGSWLSQMDGFPVTYAPITIGKKVWLPWRVFIMPGVKIGDEVVIGANSLVSKSLHSNVLAAGSPAKVLVENYPKPISEEDRSDIFNDIIKDFISYLSFNNYNVLLSKVNSSTLLKIENKKITHEIFISKNNDGHIFSNDNGLLIIDNDSYVYEGNKKIMILNLRTKKRKGTNDVGEEFTKFLSRYGVRFDRLD